MRTARWKHGITIAAVLTLASTAVRAQSWTATLSGASETPPNASPGTGFALFELNALNELTISGTFSGLSGLTTAAHAHCCTAVPFTGNAGVATTTPTLVGFPLGVTNGMFVSTIDLDFASSYNPVFLTANGGTPASARNALISGFNAGRTYLNIHTVAFPGGEINGFLRSTVPEPSTIALTAFGLLSVAVVARRRRTRPA